MANYHDSFSSRMFVFAKFAMYLRCPLRIHHVGTYAETYRPKFLSK